MYVLNSFEMRYGKCSNNYVRSKMWLIGYVQSFYTVRRERKGGNTDTYLITETSDVHVEGD